MFDWLFTQQNWSTRKPSLKITFRLRSPSDNHFLSTELDRSILWWARDFPPSLNSHHSRDGWKGSLIKTVAEVSNRALYAFQISLSVCILRSLEHFHLMNKQNLMLILICVFKSESLYVCVFVGGDGGGPGGGGG